MGDITLGNLSLKLAYGNPMGDSDITLGNSQGNLLFLSFLHNCCVLYWLCLLRVP